MEIYLDELTKESPYELGDDLLFLNIIDHGAFGTVIHVKEKSTNKDFAVKVINKLGADSILIEKMKEEVAILKKLEHENIVKFYGYMETANQFLIKMEYIKYGTLSRWIKNQKNISEDNASLIIRKLLSAVAYLHSKQICHRDIKPENIMFSKENDLTSIKIIDFGLSVQNFEVLKNHDYCGTFIYMAPEQIEKKSYYVSVDIWSIGILMYMLLNNGKHPFYKKGDKREDFINKVKSNNKLKFDNKISYMGNNLLKKLLELNPSWRYTAFEAIKHPWITRNVKDEIPLTSNEILNKFNNRQNAKNLILLSVFLNYYKKLHISTVKKERIEKQILMKQQQQFFIDEIIPIMPSRRKVEKIYKIKKEYIKKCNNISKIKKEKLKKFKEKCLDVLSTDEEDSNEKIKAYDNKSLLKKNLIINEENRNEFIYSLKKGNSTNYSGIIKHSLNSGVKNLASKIKKASKFRNSISTNINTKNGPVVLLENKELNIIPSSKKLKVRNQTNTSTSRKENDKLNNVNTNLYIINSNNINSNLNNNIDISSHQDDFLNNNKNLKHNIPTTQNTMENLLKTEKSKSFLKSNSISRITINESESKLDINNNTNYIYFTNSNIQNNGNSNINNKKKLINPINLFNTNIVNNSNVNNKSNTSVKNIEQNNLPTVIGNKKNLKNFYGNRNCNIIPLVLPSIGIKEPLFKNKISGDDMNKFKRRWKI